MNQNVDRSMARPFEKREGDALLLWYRYLNDSARLLRSYLPWGILIAIICGLVHAHVYPQFFEPGALAINPSEPYTAVRECIYVVIGAMLICYGLGWRILRGVPSPVATLRGTTLIGYSTVIAYGLLVGLSHLHPGILLHHNLLVLIVLAMSPTSIGNRLFLTLVSIVVPIATLFGTRFFELEPPAGLRSLEGGPIYNRIVEWLEPRTQLRALLSTLFCAIVGMLFQWFRSQKVRDILAQQQENERLLTAYERLLSQTLTFPASREIMRDGEYRSRKRTVVVIACDIVDYSLWSKDIHTPERITNVLSTFFQLFDHHCFNCATVRIEPLRSQGDSRIAIAGLWEPAELPDSSNRIDGSESIELSAVAAVQAMLDFTDAIRAGVLRARLLERNLPDPDLRARVGIHLGEVNKGVISTHVDTNDREEGRMWFDVWGDVVNIAARYEGLASPNSVLVSSKVLNAVGGHFEHSGLQEFEVKHGEKLKGAIVLRAVVPAVRS